jgi:transposase-like protein
LAEKIRFSLLILILPSGYQKSNSKIVTIILKIFLEKELKLILYCQYIAMFSNENKPKSSFKYFCDFCDYGTCKKSNIDNHYATSKHINSMNGNQKKPNLSSNYTCQNCQKTYKDNSGLWRHKKKCLSKTDNSLNNTSEINSTDKQLIMMLIKDNTELKNMMMEVIKNGTHNITNTNSNNKSFNLNFFLNETCKDAMNIMDFVDSIKLQLSDLEKVGEIGYVDGISNIITSNLKALDITQRPIHCTDKKRDVLYVKDQNKWEKEDDEKNKLRKAIKRVACKNQRLIPKFKEAHPDCVKSSSKFSDQYNKMIIESMGGSGDNDLEKEDKIIRNISKNVVIDKNN